MTDRPRCVIFGAGALGLGFLGPELAPDASLTFCDIPAKAGFVNHVKDAGSYTFNQTGLSMRAVQVDGVRALLIGEDDAAIDAAVDEADFVITSVGQSNLKYLADRFAAAVERRTDDRPLRILCSENGVEIAAGLRELVTGAIGEDPGAALLIGETVMGRMCKVIEEPGAGVLPLGPDVGWGVVAEPFYGIPVEAHALEGLAQIPAAIDPQAPDRFKASEDVKMLAHNALHLLLGLLGQRRGAEFYDDIRSHPQVMELGRRAVVEEAGPALLRKHGGALPRNEYLNYCDSILRRITCPVLHDPIGRGVRGIMRKLQPHERIVHATRTIVAQGIEPRTYARGLAAAIDLAIESGQTDKDFDGVLAEHCGISPDDDTGLCALVQEAREELA
jgi:mannitol-1-phosphate/altronate dehydrogenase